MPNSAGWEKLGNADFSVTHCHANGELQLDHGVAKRRIYPQV
jgi:hypothetical protein